MKNNHVLHTDPGEALVIVGTFLVTILFIVGLIGFMVWKFLGN